MSSYMNNIKRNMQPVKLIKNKVLRNMPIGLHFMNAEKTRFKK